MPRTKEKKAKTELVITSKAVEKFNRAAQLQEQFWDALREFEAEVGQDFDSLAACDLWVVDDNEGERRELAEFLITNGND